jgi:hypothetical protein
LAHNPTHAYKQTNYKQTDPKRKTSPLLIHWLVSSTPQKKKKSLPLLSAAIYGKE